MRLFPFNYPDPGRALPPAAISDIIVGYKMLALERGQYRHTIIFGAEGCRVMPAYRHELIRSTLRRWSVQPPRYRFNRFHDRLFVQIVNQAPVLALAVLRYPPGRLSDEEFYALTRYDSAYRERFNELRNRLFESITNAT